MSESDPSSLFSSGWRDYFYLMNFFSGDTEDIEIHRLIELFQLSTEVTNCSSEELRLLIKIF